MRNSLLIPVAVSKNTWITLFEPDKKSRRTKLLFSAASLRPGSGGIAELSRQVLVALVELHTEGSIELEVCVLDDAGPEPDDELLRDGKISSIRWYKGNRLNFVWHLLGAKPDLMLFDHVGLARLPGLLPRFIRPRYVLLIHGVEIWQQNRRDYHRTARHACLLISNSEYTARKSQNRYRDLPPIQVCLPGKDFSKPTNIVSTGLAEKLGPRAMLIVGRLDAKQRHKGHDHLLQAMPFVLQQVPDAQLVIAGSGDDRMRLEQLASNLGITEQILFTGWCNESELKELYERCALFVMPSAGDGFGLVYLEAMQHGIPCVGLQNTAAEEVIENGVSGMLVDRDDISGMADQLAKLLLDADQRKKLGDAGLARQQSQFRTQHYVSRLKTLLMSLINQTRKVTTRVTTGAAPELK